MEGAGAEGRGDEVAAAIQHRVCGVVSEGRRSVPAVLVVDLPPVSYPRRLLVLLLDCVGEFARGGFGFGAPGSGGSPRPVDPGGFVSDPGSVSEFSFSDSG